MRAAAPASACRGAVFVPDRPVDQARGRARLHGVVARPAARRRLLVDPASARSRDAVDVGREIVQVDEDLASTEQILPLADVYGKTVQVKFVLQKQCAFGQRFLVVGDDPALGLWDPTNASALDWSEGHVWTVKKDLPAGKLVEFKFLLQDPSGQVRWQDGSNRVLQIIIENSNTLVVSEDWDDAKCQKVSEEAHLSIQVDLIFFASNVALLSYEQPTDQNQETNNSVTDVIVYGEKTSAVGGLASLQYENQKVPVSDEVRRKANELAQNGNPVAVAQYAGRNNEDAENRPARIFHNDMVWIRKALVRLLQSFGIQIGTTKT